MCHYSTLKNELVVGFFFERLLAVLDPVVTAALRIGVLFFVKETGKGARGFSLIAEKPTASIKILCSIAPSKSLPFMSQ